MNCANQEVDGISAKHARRAGARDIYAKKAGVTAAAADTRVVDEQQAGEWRSCRRNARPRTIPVFRSI
jgi:hypothetical protein